MIYFVKKFSEVVEKSSGALSFGIIQSFIMIGMIANLSPQTGVRYFILLTITFIATMSTVSCMLSTVSVINEVTGKHKYMKFLFGVPLYPSFIGVILSTYLSIKALIVS